MKLEQTALWCWVILFKSKECFPFVQVYFQVFLECFSLSFMEVVYMLVVLVPKDVFFVGCLGTWSNPVTLKSESSACHLSSKARFVTVHPRCSLVSPLTSSVHWGKDQFLLSPAHPALTPVMVTLTGNQGASSAQPFPSPTSSLLISDSLAF